VHRLHEKIYVLTVLVVLSLQLLLPIDMATSQTVDSYYPVDYNLLGATAYVSGVLTDLQSDNNVYMIFRSYLTRTEAIDFPNLISDVDLSPDKGTHSNFTAQQYGPDLINDILTETREYGGVQTVVATGSVPYQMDKDQKGCFGAVFWNPTDNVYRVTRVEFNASSATNEVFNDRDQGIGLSYPISGWERDAARRVIYWTGIINVQPHMAQEFYVDIDGNGKDEVFTVAVRITANGTVYSNDYVAKQVNGDVPWSIVWLGHGPTPAFNISVLPSTETTFYVSLEEDCNKMAIDIGGTLTILVPSEFTNVVDVGGTGWGSANITGNKIEVKNTQSIQDTYRTYAFNTSTPSIPGLYMLNVSFSGTPDEHPVGNFSIHVAGIPNSELDLEIQWTSIDYSLANGELCVYGGSMGAENIMVDFWNGSSWENLFPDLNFGWNNVSVSPYLISSTFTVRFKGGNEAGDTTQDWWDIDVNLLHVWSDEYTSEVEFTGSSNTEDLSQLNWTANSAWTIDLVNVMLQLFDYTLDDYSTTGDGYIAYTSSATSYTDETISQTITTNSTNFRDGSGNWKMKIKGFKITTLPFDFRADLIKFEATSVVTPDVAVLNIIRTSASAYLGDIITINVTVKNEGGTAETFNVTAYYNETQIGKQTALNLAPDTNANLTFYWNTTGVLPGIYTIQAVADTVPGEMDTADNTYIDDIVEIKEHPVARAPVALFSFSPSHPAPNTTVLFNATDSLDPDGSILIYSWDFGDGNTTSTSSSLVTHNYQEHGDFNVTLTIIDNDNYNDSTSQIITIYLHDVAVLNSTLSQTDVDIGQVININVTVKNKGTITETFSVHVFYNETLIGTQLVSNLPPNTEKILSFYWNTTGITPDVTYTIKAETSIVPGEINILDNIYPCGIVRVQSQGPPPLDWRPIIPYIVPVGITLVGFFLGITWKRRGKSPKVLGFDFFDKIVGGDIPTGSSVLILGGTASGKSLLCQQLTHKYINEGKACLFVSYDDFPRKIRESMKSFGWDLSKQEQEKNFTFIDCYSSRARKASQERYSIQQPFALTELSIVSSTALDEIKEAQKVLFLDSATSLFTNLDPSRVMSFLQDRGAKMKGENGIFIFTLGEGVVKPDIVNRLEEAVDGIIELNIYEEEGQSLRRMRVKKLRGQRHLNEWVLYDIKADVGIVFLNSKNT